MIELTMLGIKHQSLVQDYFSLYPPEISEHTFINLFVWGNSRPVYFAEVADSLLLFIDARDSSGQYKILFGPPVGKLSLSEAIKILGDTIVGAVRLPTGSVQELIDADYTLHADRSNADYVYLVDDLAHLAGRHYSKKRNQIKKCLRAYNCKYEPVTADLIPLCMAMQQRWCLTRSCTTDPGLCAEYAAIVLMFENFSRLGLIGGAIRVDGDIQAFTVGEQLHPDVAVCHFEKALPGIQGLGQLVNQWFALNTLGGDYIFVNREQDLGVPGLRQAKKSYHPHHLVEKYTLFLNGDEPSCITAVELNRCRGKDLAFNNAQV